MNIEPPNPTSVAHALVRAASRLISTPMLHLSDSHRPERPSRGADSQSATAGLNPALFGCGYAPFGSPLTYAN
jgi:hypothetical protein